jgi:sirohydrochlorin cobaltochelatase
MTSATGIILYVHGARDPRWAEPFHRLRAKVAERAPAQSVTVAFLEHITPDLPQAAAEMAADGVNRIRVVPVFLGRGGHLREDLPRQLDAARASVPSVTFEVTEAAGENEMVLDALAKFALEAAVIDVDDGSSKAA